MVVEPEKIENLDNLFLRIVVESVKDNVKINMPMKLVKLAVDIGMAMPQVSGNKALENLDFEKILSMVESGIMGKLIEVETASDTISVFVEKR